MKTNITFCLLVFPLLLTAQTAVDKSIAVSNGQRIAMNFDYPELIRVSTWDKKEISIHAEVKINNGENDDAFELLVAQSGDVITIENKIRDIKNLPQMITVVDGGEKIIFKNKEEYRKFKNEKGSSHERVSWGVDIEIILDIKVPKDMETSITSIYGMVEVKDFVGPLNVIAKYGGVDAVLNENTVGELSAETNYGQIYSDLKVKLVNDGFREKDFYTFVSAKPGSGPHYDFESQYGNVYLRKAK